VTVTAFPTQHAIESYGCCDTWIARVWYQATPTQCKRDRCVQWLRRVDSRGDFTGLARSNAPARRKVFEKFSAKFRTTTTQRAELAAKAKPKLLVLYHHSGNTPENWMPEMGTAYTGHFIVSRDLDVY